MTDDSHVLKITLGAADKEIVGNEASTVRPLVHITRGGRPVGRRSDSECSIGLEEGDDELSVTGYVDAPAQTMQKEIEEDEVARTGSDMDSMVCDHEGVDTYSDRESSDSSDDSYEEEVERRASVGSANSTVRCSICVVDENVNESRRSAENTNSVSDKNWADSISDNRPTEAMEPCGHRAYARAFRDDNEISNEAVRSGIAPPCTVAGYEKWNAQLPRTRARRSEVHGKGLFIEEDVNAGTRVNEYTGNRIISILCGRAAIRMIWSLYYHGEDVHRLANIQSEGGVVDPRNCGNETQYFNHSCIPNCIMEEKGVGGHTFIYLKCIVDIAAGTELRIDYYRGQACSRRRRPMKCKLGASSCRGYLWQIKNCIEAMWSEDEETSIISWAQL